MRYLIVNGDDLGMSPGVNRGIIEAQRRGILTSASLMVDALASEDAAALAATAPDLSLGLHVELVGRADKLRNAWVSDRTLCYLASGKPAVIQHTGASS